MIQGSRDARIWRHGTLTYPHRTLEDRGGADADNVWGGFLLALHFSYDNDEKSSDRKTGVLDDPRVVVSCMILVK